MFENVIAYYPRTILLCQWADTSDCRSSERMSMVQKWQVERPGNDERIATHRHCQWARFGDFGGDVRTACDPGTYGLNQTLWFRSGSALRPLRGRRCQIRRSATDTEPFSDGARAPLNSTDGTRAPSVPVADLSFVAAVAARHYRNDTI